MTYNSALPLSAKLKTELVQHILPFWMQKMTDHEQGGFYGRMDGNNRLIIDAPKGGILNARILWTFAAAYRELKNPEYLAAAERAKNYIFDHFFDTLSGGTYWSLDYKGQPLDTKKQIYSQAFFIYALSEYHLATTDAKCRDTAISLFKLIEEHSFDTVQNGYFEAYSRDWQLLNDLRLSEKDANEKKTMNTHLHILEAYTNLYRTWKADHLAKQLRNLINLFTEKIIDPKTNHLNLFFAENWECKSNITSYGHDIESSWLLYEAACVLGDEKLIAETAKISLKITEASMEGLQPDGSIIYEKNTITEHIDTERHWWPQAEAVVGFYNAYELTADVDFLQKAVKSYEYIRAYLTDRENGEWFWSCNSDGTLNHTDDKAGFWKCPYHNGRMCLEIIRRSC